MSTYGDLRPQIERNCGNRTDTDSQASMLFYINAAQKILANAYPWRELQVQACVNLSEGVGDYTVELERFHHFYSITLINSTRVIPLTFYSPLKWDKEIAPLRLTAAWGKPSVCTYWGNTFSIFRTPDDDYQMTVRYYQWPTPIVDDSSEIQIQNVDEILVYLTTAMFWDSLEELQLGSVYAKRAVELLKLYTGQDISLKAFDTPSGLSTPKTLSTYWTDPFVKTIPGGGA
jgi:hypothetical protein